MPKLYACCTDPKCPTFREMVLKLQVYGVDPTPKRDGSRLYFDALIPDAWNLSRRYRFAEVVRFWPKSH